MKNVPVEIPRRKDLTLYREDDQLAETLSAFESETAGVLARTSPRSDRITLNVLAIMVIVAIGLSAVVKLERVVTGTGTVVSVGGPLYVSPLNPGVVMSIKVKPGDVVEKDQVLATMDSTLANADRQGAVDKIDSDQAEVERLTAEYNDRVYIPKTNGSYTDVQMSIWHQRQSEYKANVGSLDAQIAAAQGLIDQYRQDEAQYRKRYQLAARRQEMVAPLIAKGYVSEMQLNTAQDATEELARQTADSQKLIQQQVSTQMSLRQQRAAYIEHWHSDTGAQLVSARNDLDATQQTLDKAQKTVEMNTLVAPAKAIVLKIASVSSGSIAGLGGPADINNPQLITLSPLEAPLQVEFNVASADVAFIRAGDPVAVKLDAYSFIRHGLVRGSVKSISEGSFTRDENGNNVPPYFKVRAEINKVELREIPQDFRMVPGMTLIADVHIGKRTLLSYIVEGALKTGREAMREAQ